MKTVNRTYHLIEVADLESAVSDHFGWKVKVGDMDVEMMDWVGADEKPENRGLYFRISPKEPKNHGMKSFIHSI